MYFFVYDFSSFHLGSFRDTIGWKMYCQGWWSSIASDRTLFLSFEQVWCRPNTLCLDVCSMLYACTVQDAVLPSRSSQDLCVLCSKDLQAESYLSAFCSNSGLRVSILNLWWNVFWLHIRRDICTRRNRLELTHCPVMKDPRDCVLNDLEVLGGKEILLKDRYNTEIFCFLLLLPLCSSTFYQTNDDNTKNISEDTPLICRIQSLHHLLEVDYHDEEEWSSISPTRDNQWRKNLVVQDRSKFFPQQVQFLWMSWQKRLCGFALAVDEVAKSPALNFNAYSSKCISEVSCSLSSCFLLLKSVTNLFTPWKILTHE